MIIDFERSKLRSEVTSTVLLDQEDDEDETDRGAAAEEEEIWSVWCEAEMQAVRRLLAAV